MGNFVTIDSDNNITGTANLNAADDLGTQNVIKGALDMAINAGSAITALVTDVTLDGDIDTIPANCGYDTATATSLTGTSIDTAAGAMLIDDLMQKISTKVQVAAQLLATENRLQKEVTRALQG